MTPAEREALEEALRDYVLRPTGEERMLRAVRKHYRAWDRARLRPQIYFMTEQDFVDIMRWGVGAITGEGGGDTGG